MSRIANNSDYLSNKSQAEKDYTSNKREDSYTLNTDQPIELIQHILNQLRQDFEVTSLNVEGSKEIRPEVLKAIFNSGEMPQIIKLSTPIDFLHNLGYRIK